MGDDAALAFFERRVPVAEYLRERFAQVTNPPIDPLREALVFDLRAWVGSGDVHGDVPAPHAIVALENAIVSELDFDALRFDARLTQYPLNLSLEGTSLRARILAICDEAEKAVRAGVSLLVFDDREDRVSVPVLLAVGAVHQRLVQRGLRMQASLAAADGYARDAHAIAALISSGANVVAPWLGLRAAARRRRRYEISRRAPRRDAEGHGQARRSARCAPTSAHRPSRRLVCAREILDQCFPGMNGARSGAALLRPGSGRARLVRGVARRSRRRARRIAGRSATAARACGAPSIPAPSRSCAPAR